jgi:glycosyltransferase involved in cell wall biosynthesis
VFLQDHGPHPLHGRLDNDGVPWEALPGGARSLYYRLRSGQPILLHTHGYKANLLGRATGRLLGIPVLATFHAGDRPGGWLALYDIADRWTAFLGGRIAVSRPIEARQPFGATLVPNFVALPPDAGLTHPDTVAFVGRLAPEKGPDLFCDLADRATRSAPGLAFHLYGDGPLRAGLRDRTGVLFQGARAGMGDAWADIGLLAVTSRAEGLPLAALEAMAHGVPVASFAVGGMPDLITHGVNGFLAPAGDVAALADHTLTWHRMGPDGRERMAKAAIDTIHDRYSRAAGVNRVVAIYDAVIAPLGAGPRSLAR